jgi:hypothetical protein
MGELVVLRHLLRANPQLLSTWCSPDDGLHDFAGGGHAIEIKSTIGPAAGLRISNLDQLDASGGSTCCTSAWWRDLMVSAWMT